MSFTSEVKNEVTKLELTETENMSELSAIIRNAYIDDKKILITTEISSLARRIYTFIKDIYHISPKIILRKGYNYQKKILYILEINSHNNNINNILEDMGLSKENNFNIPKSFITDDSDILRAYLRGLFLMTGSINDPKKSRYHLEFIVNDIDYAEFIKGLLNSYLLNSKIIKRDNKYMIYVKEAEKIGDFLRIISAFNAVLYYEDIRIYRDHKNMTNRLNNCEQANVDRMIETSNNQIKDIEIIEEIGGLDLLDEKEKEVAIYRKKYPDASLNELSEIITIETGRRITKSGLYHRFKKIKELAERIRNKH